VPIVPDPAPAHLTVSVDGVDHEVRWDALMPLLAQALIVQDAVGTAPGDGPLVLQFEVPAVVLAAVRAWLTRTAAGEDVDPGSMFDELVVAG
jgi:hypothetical protein